MQASHPHKSDIGKSNLITDLTSLEIGHSTRLTEFCNCPWPTTWPSQILVPSCRELCSIESLFPHQISTTATMYSVETSDCASSNVSLELDQYTGAVALSTDPHQHTDLGDLDIHVDLQRLAVHKSKSSLFERIADVFHSRQNVDEASSADSQSCSSSVDTSDGSMCGTPRGPKCRVSYVQKMKEDIVRVSRSRLKRQISNQSEVGLTSLVILVKYSVLLRQKSQSYQYTNHRNWIG